MLNLKDNLLGISPTIMKRRYMFFLRSQACKNHFSFKKVVLDTDRNTKTFIYTQHLEETSHPSVEWIRVLWCTKLFNVHGANWYSRPALGQCFITAINPLAACYVFQDSAWYVCVCVRLNVCFHVCKGKRRELNSETSPLHTLQPEKLCDCELSNKTQFEFNMASILRSAMTI